MSIRDTLQNALIGANNERLNWHHKLEEYDARLIQLKANRQRAETQKAGAVMIRDAADQKHREAVNYSNGLTDQYQKNALRSEIERLAGEITITSGYVGEADEMVRGWQRQITDLDKDRAVAQMNSDAAHEKWSQIRKQLDDVTR
jgi:hypothetical protein